VATDIYMFNGQVVQSTGFTGPGLAAGVDDDEARELTSAGYAALASAWEGGS
jgi:hypothetical protein